MPKSAVLSERQKKLFDLYMAKRNKELQGNASPQTPGGGLAYPELREQAMKLLAQDQGRLASSSYLTTYPGANQTPMSALTQNSRQYQQEFANKGVPFTKKNQTVANRSKEGFSPQGQQEILNLMRQGQSTFNKGTVERQLGKQFGASLPYIQGDLSRKGEKDLNQNLDTADYNLKNVSRAAADVDQRHNQSLTGLLQTLGQDKQYRRKDLVNTLDDFAKSKHAHGNMQIEADRNKFNQEVNSPYQQIGLLQRLISGQGAGANDLHPDIATANAQELQQGLRAYGIDPSKPVEQWGSSRTSQPNYSGQRVADINPTLQAAYDTMERISPKTRDANYSQTKAGVKELLNSGNISEQVLASLPAEIRASIRDLDLKAKRENKTGLKKLGQQYAKINSHGSGAHMKAAAEMARELQKRVMEQREKLFKNSIEQQLGYRENEGANQIRNTLQSAQAGSNDYNTMMNNLRNAQRTGLNIFNNEQDEQDQLYKNYQNEWASQWPQNRGSIAAGGALGAQGVAGGIIGAMAQEAPLNRGNVSHSEVNRAPRQSQPSFANTQQVQQSMQHAAQQAQVRQQQLQAQRQAEQSEAELARYNEQYRLDQIEADRLRRARNFEPAINTVRYTGEHLRGVGHY